MNFEKSNTLKHFSRYLLIEMGRPKKQNGDEKCDSKLPWTDKMNLALLKLVLDNGAHLPHIKYDPKHPPVPTNGKPVYLSKPSDRFRVVTQLFYADTNSGLPFKEKFFKLDKDGLIDYRRLQDHYKSLCKTVKEDMATGNQSGKEGDRSELYTLVEQLSNEHDAAAALDDEEKQEGIDLKERLDTTVNTVLNGKKHNANKNTAVKIKQADGTIVIDEEREAKKARVMGNSLDGKIAAVLDRFVNQKSELEERMATVETIKTQMQQYVLLHGHCLEAFLFQVYEDTDERAPPEYLERRCKALGGLSNLIKLYCTRDDNFESARFKDLMAEFGIKAMDARLMHMHLETWRTAAAEFAEDQLQRKKKSKTGKNSDGLSDLTTSTTVEETMASQEKNPQQDNPPQDNSQQEAFPENNYGLLGLLMDAANVN